MPREFGLAAAARKVTAPAIGMMVCSILGLLYNIAWTVWVLLSGGAGLGAELASRGMSYLMVAAPALAATVYAAMLFGSVRMYQRTSYRWAVAASVLALMPCNVFTVVSVGFGIWGIVVLRNPAVKPAFK